MQANLDIFGIWPNATTLAREIGQKPDTVFRWTKRGRIPETFWEDVIVAAGKRGTPIDAGDLLAFNAPMKKRGWPRKVRAIRRKRAEARAS